MTVPELRLPPHSIEAEQSVLGGLLLDNLAIDKIADFLAESHFYRGEHRRIFRAIQRLIDMAKPADVLTVAEALHAAGEEDATGGLAYLGELAANTPSASNIRRYAEIVREKAMRRDLLAIAGQIEGECFGQCTDAEKIALAAEGAMLSLLDRRGGEPAPLADVVREAIAYVDDRCQRGGALAGLATGFDGFDALTGGLEPGQLVIVAARPSVGKTILGLNVADRVALGGHSVLFFSLEMSKREIGMRLLAARARVSVHAMRVGTNDPDHWSGLSRELAAAGGQRLFVDDSGAIGVGYVRAKARRIKRQHGLDLIVIDYLGLMKGQGDNRTQEIGSLSRGLKALAKELGVPIIALAQLNRGVENRQDKRPLLSDLRDSGEVEQDADIVAMLHREAMYHQAPEWDGVAELLIRKNRNGPLGDVRLRFCPESMRFDAFEGDNPRIKQTSQAPTGGGNKRGFDDA